MTEQNEKERKKRIRFFWIGLPVFLIILVAFLSYTGFVLTPKYDYGICSMLNLYRQPKNSVDVLAIGTSQVYTGINTNVLWEEYGIAAYSLTTAEEAYWFAYYYLVEALKTQTPKVVLLDTKASSYPDDYNKHGRVILGSYGIMSPSVRIQAVNASAKPEEEKLGYILQLPEVHSNYVSVEAESFIIPPSNAGRGSSWKGYIENEETEQHERPSFVWTNTKKQMNAREEEYFNKIMELCTEKNIPIMLVSMPYPDYGNDHMYVNRAYEIAAEYGVTGINYNNPDLRFGLRFSSDFADWQHLNVKGSVKFSRKLAEDLIELYDLPDHRGDPYYSSYDECAEIWKEKYPDYIGQEV